jgi:tellurite resistance protein TerC
MPASLLPFADYWWFYLAFTALIAVLLTVDLGLHGKAEAVSFREALTWTGIWVALALAFSYGVSVFASSRFSPAVGRQLTLEFLAGYVVEESLSVDNMFVFAVIFRFFSIPSRYQHRVLFYGILGAMVFRAIFIAIGSALVQFHWTMIVFGVFLVFTGIRLAVGRDKEIRPGDNPIIRLAHRLFPVDRELRGPTFFTRVDGVRHLTPLMVVLLALETTDIVFAIDSVPAVFGVTREPLIVYTSNVFAILGLRSMYFLLAGAMDRFHALKYGLALVLVFVGVKMAVLDGLAGGRFPIDVSLAVISSVIVLSVVVSIAFPRAVAEAARGAPSLRRLAVGAGFLLLATLDLLVATGQAGDWFPPAALAQIHVESLVISAVCYAASGALLLVARPTSEELLRALVRPYRRLGALRLAWSARRHPRPK